MPTWKAARIRTSAASAALVLAQILAGLFLIAHLVTPAAGQQHSTIQAKPASSADSAFRAQVAEFVEAEMQLYPERATRLGDHRFDNQLNDLSASGLDRVLV